jgi:hypothetical protein
MRCDRCGKDVDPVYPHTCTPLALKLAAQADQLSLGEIAAELRKQYEEIVRLTEALKMAHLDYSGCMEDLKEAEKALIPGEPVAWGMVNSRSGQIYDCISPAQHAEHEGSYTVPLYTAPQPQPNHFRDATEKVHPCNPAEDGVCEALECCKQLREQNTMLDAEAAKDEALLRQALEALTAISGDVCNYVHHAKKDQHPYGEVCPVHVRHDQAIAALRERLKA